MKDEKVEGFYTNDLQAMPTMPLLPLDSKEAIHAVNGICSIRKWIGLEVTYFIQTGTT